jgi:hypothetical protein
MVDPNTRLVRVPGAGLPRARSLRRSAVTIPRALFGMHPRASVLQASLSWERFLPSWPLIIGFLGFAEAMATPALLHDPDTYLHVAAGGDERALLEFLDKYRIGWTMLQPRDGAVAVLDRLPGWHRAYADAQAVVNLRAR